MILNLKHRRVLVALALALIAGGAHAVPGEQQTPESAFRTPPSVDPHVQAAVDEPHRPLYETRAIHDQNDTGSSTWVDKSLR
jgi:hypothetical protein